MHYKGFIGIATIDLDAKVLRGRVMNTRSVITFVSPTVEGLEEEFHTSIDVYLEVCKEQGIAPEKPVAGKILLRTGPALQKAAAAAAARQGVSLNAYVSGLIEHDVSLIEQQGGMDAASGRRDERASVPKKRSTKAGRKPVK